MTASQFIKQEKKTGILSKKKKITSFELEQILNKYASLYYEEKVKHLDIKSIENSYLKGVTIHAIT